MRRLLFSLLMMFAALAANAQVAVGTWQHYRAYGNATAQVIADGLVYCLASGNLFAYDLETTELQTFDNSTGLGGYGINFMDYDPQTHTLVLVYGDGLIDLMDTRTQEVVSLVALRESNMGGKTVNGLFVNDGNAWLFTGFGFVKVDLVGQHFGDTYNIKKNVISATICNGVLYYCVRSDGMYSALLSNNLHEGASHERIRGYQFTIFATLGDFIYGYGFSSLVQFNTVKNLSASTIGTGVMRSMRVSGDRLIASYDSKVVAIDTEGKLETMLANVPGMLGVSCNGSDYWASCGLNGLQQLRIDEDGVLQPTGMSLIPNSPRYDYFYRMHYVGDCLLVAGGAQEYTANSVYKGMASLYKDGEWTNLDTVMIGKESYENLTGIAQHPSDPSLHYVTSMGHGVYVYRDGHLEERYSLYNSPLNSALPRDQYDYNYVFVNAPTFDAEGNLWVLNSQTDTVVWRFTPESKKWKGFYFDELKGVSCVDGIIFDSKDRMWVLSRRLDGRGILCYDKQSKKHCLRTKVNQQDGISYNIDNFLCMAMDKFGYIWVGTDAGLYVIDKLDEYFDDDFEFTQIKVNRNDGSGLADYLLSSAYVSAIAIDGGNRKWIGTLGSGVYLLSADGQETIHHFTADNSPLPSDDVRSIAVNPNTGEVMIGTMDGLVSYMSDATEPEESLREDNIVIYPNPVRPEYEGDVVIRGLAADCEVKIATVGGQVVWSDTSVGGTCTWNLQRKGGGRVSSGVYNVIINTADASNVIVGRLAVIR